MLLYLTLLLLATTAVHSDQDVISGEFPMPTDAQRFETNALHELARANPGQGCYCNEKSQMCACCEHLTIARFHLDEVACAEVVYMPQELGASFLLELDNIILVNKTVSERDPPPMCYTIPGIPLDAQLCLQVYDLDFNWQKLTFSGCGKILANLVGFEIFSVKLGCFNLPILKVPQEFCSVREEL